MIYDPAYPPDDLSAKTLDVPLRSAKTLIRERAVANNGAWDEHSFFGDGATGSHPLSQVGWVAIYSSHASMLATNCPVGSLHFVSTDADPTKIGLYVKDDVSFVLMVSSDHRALSISTSDIHSQYYLRDGSRQMSTPIKLGVPLVQTSPGTDDDNPMPGSHNSQSWYAGHGVDGELIVNRHFSDGAINLVNSEFITASRTRVSGNTADAWMASGSGNRKYISIPAVSITGGNPVGSGDTRLSLLMDKSNEGSSIHVRVQVGLFDVPVVNHMQSYDVPAVSVGT